jgi:hypothetical protein
MRIGVNGSQGSSKGRTAAASPARPISGEDAYDYLVSVYQDASEDPKLRVQAAVAALPYERARLNGAAIAAAEEEKQVSEARRTELIEQLMDLVNKREAAVIERERRLEAAEAGQHPSATP